MMNEKLSLLVLITIIITSLSFSGCISKDKENDKSSTKEESFWAYDSFDGAMMTGAREQPASGTHNLNIELKNIPILQVILNITYEDGDEGTEPDVIEESTMTGIDNSGKEMTYTISGGTMPYSDQFILKADEGKYFQQNFTVVDTFTAYASEDSWPGPIIWRGTTDEVFYYHLDISIEYFGVEEEETNE